MMNNSRTSGRNSQASGVQQGVYAVEFALMFSLFFLVFYTVLTYALIFAAQQSLNLAAENGARKALGWQLTRDARAVAAESEANRMAGWVNALGGKDALTVETCYGSPAPVDGVMPPAQASASPASCQAQQADQFKVVLLYHYHFAPLVPLLGPHFLAQNAVPKYLRAEASVSLGIASQSAPQGSP